MKVVHIITSLTHGGAEGVLYRLATADKEHTHHVISLMDGGYYGERFNAAGIRVDMLNMPRSRLTLRGVAKLFRLVRAIRPDVIQTWMYHADLIGGVIARLAGIHAIVWSIRNSDLDPSTTSRSTRLIVWLCSRLSAVVPRKIISNSAQAATVHTAIGYDQRKLVILPNGYDMRRLAPDADARGELRAQWRIGPETVLLGMVARWHSHKDHPNLIAALAQLKARGTDDWCCALIGPDIVDTNADLVALLDKHGVRDRVRLLGPRSDIAPVMNALDLHVLSSIGEAFPNVVAESLACGTPVVVTDVGDAKLIVGETGWVVPAANSAKLADAIASAMAEMSDAIAWQARKAAARQRAVDKFDIDRMVQAYRSVWRLVSEQN